jgi:hypothetical protein
MRLYPPVMGDFKLSDHFLFIAGVKLCSQTLNLRENYFMTRSSFILTFLFCSLFAASILAHNMRQVQIKIDLSQEVELIVDDGRIEVKQWPVTMREIDRSDLCVCNEPDNYEVNSCMYFGDSSQPIELAHYGTNQFNNGLFQNILDIIGGISFTGSQFIAKIFDFPATSWSFSPKDSLFEITPVHEQLTGFNIGDVLFMSPIANAKKLTNFKGTHLAIFLGRHTKDGRPILLSTFGGSIFATDLLVLTTLFPKSEYLFRLRCKDQRMDLITVFDPSSGFNSL